MAAFTAGISLGGCDVAPNIKLYNGVGRPLALEVALGDHKPKRAQLDPGGSVRIWSIYGPDFRVRMEGCERRYRLPYMDLNHPWRVADDRGGSTPDYAHQYPVEVQLEPDGSLYLMPYRATAIVSGRELAGVQEHGYPLTPVAIDCPG